jgi:hypothetical protein
MSSGKAQFAAESLMGMSDKHECAFFASSELPDASWNAPATPIEEGSLLCRLSEQERRSILSAARERSFSSHQNIFREGDPASAFFFLASGRVKLTRLSCTGDQIPSESSTKMKSSANSDSQPAVGTHGRRKPWNRPGYSLGASRSLKACPRA